VVEAVADTDFVNWVEATLVESAKIATRDIDWTMAIALQRGQNLYGRYCAACHKRDGTGLPPTFPSLVSSSVTVGNSVERHIDLVLQGVPESAMQGFAPQLDDEELAAIVTYERNAWGHDSGDLVTPAQVQAQRP